MEAGRELDALIAEKVMGFHKHRIHGYLHNAPSDEVWDAADLASFEYDYFWPSEEPHYSTNIADAWEVVEKFQDFDVLKTAHGYQVTAYGTDEHGDWQAQECADTPELAICLAALKAKGVTHE